jgi:hypothetical protein
LFSGRVNNCTDKKMKKRITLDFDQPSQLAGQLHQIACDAVDDALRRQAERDAIDLAYFNCNITLEWSELSVDEFKPLRTVRVEKTEHI